ncbi:YggS family pyridoxal phosphate-dependent enzyme [Candidatus Woesearchaeota archaeon]|jgi:hypothetical protein|nr:YggS family pyridoxal phosphate-dependent enzyme [Candidatus Woesearchaeota archaeon]|tara:strand:- start:1808 stop:2461 length:654 start_codon:yes stop_codon:yes gene_type:complete
MSILKNLSAVKKKIEETKLIVVTKNRSVREINQAIFLGVKDIGENKVQEAKQKKSLVKKRINWHFIGHLQRNKVKDAVKLFDLIHSVDSYRLARKIDSVAKFENKKMAVLVQVNISEEKQKFGLSEEEVIPLIKKLINLKNLKVLGLMAIAPFVSAEETRPYFRRMKKLFEKCKKADLYPAEMKYLSLGMSNDYEVAKQEGANMLRVGRIIFENKKN